MRLRTFFFIGVGLFYDNFLSVDKVNSRCEAGNGDGSRCKVHAFNESASERVDVGLCRCCGLTIATAFSA